MMKNITATILGLSLAGIVSAAGAVPGAIPGGQLPPDRNPTVRNDPRPISAVQPVAPMTPDQALAVLMGNGYIARPYYSGVPDPVVVQRVDNRARMRAMINNKLRTLVIPKVDALYDYTMEAAIEALENIFKAADPDKQGFRMDINPFVDPGGVPLQPAGGGACPRHQTRRAHCGATTEGATSSCPNAAGNHHQRSHNAEGLCRHRQIAGAANFRCRKVTARALRLAART